MIFDAPGMRRAGFDERYKKLQEVMSNVNCPQIKLLNHIVCESREDMEKYMDKITNANGEGVMLRTPDSMYE
jgi:DNA ligase-1